MKNDVIELLFKKHYNEALLYLLSLSNNKALAEEILSDAFYKALNTADDSIRNFKSWLLTICRNLYYNHFNKQKSIVELDNKIKDESESIIDKIIKDERYKALYHAISLLDNSYKEVIILFYFESMPISHIAKLTNKNENAIKVMLYRAKEKLRTILEVNNYGLWKNIWKIPK